VRYTEYMKTVYSANNALEANLLKHLLAQEDVAAYIYGEFLQGGVGELPVNGIVRIMVDEQDVARAEKVLRRWEQGGYTLVD